MKAAACDGTPEEYSPCFFIVFLFFPTFWQMTEYIYIALSDFVFFSKLLLPKEAEKCFIECFLDRFVPENTRVVCVCVGVSVCVEP